MTQASPETVSRDAVSFGLTVGLIGLAFGATSTAAGLSVAQTCVLSLLAYTGGTQFAVVGVVASGGSPVAALAGGWLLASRHILYAVRLGPLLQLHGPRRFLAAFGTTDESTGMANAQLDPALAVRAFWWTAGALYLSWNLSTLLGAVGVSALGDPAELGLDAIVPAAFLALLAPRLRNDPHSRDVALLAGLIAVLALPLVPAGLPVLMACGAVAVALWQPRR